MKTDVCLILEGTYPYVAGGVSTWVAQILSAMPGIHFSIVYIGPKRDMPREFKYQIPANVYEIKEIFVHDYPDFSPDIEAKYELHSSFREALVNFSEALFKGEAADFKELLGFLEGFADDRQFFQALAHSQAAWDMVVELYEKLAGKDSSFIDFFWSYRFITLPALSLLRTKLPRAKVYHCACTGYAGLLGAKAAITTGAPLLISEHGIYTRERRIEIFNSSWIRDAATEATSLDMRRKKNFYKEWWVRFFLSLSRTAYRDAEHIFSLFEANRRDQIAEGADAEKVSIIPNGIDLKKFLGVEQRKRKQGEPFNIGFVGRVTEIKDVKTLIRTFDILKQRKVNFKAYIMGPLDEEEDYAKECQELAESLLLAEEVEFTGRVDINEYLPRMDAVVLTSISEGLPFVILEANCAGIPVVSTKVGACRELLQGRDEEDISLGDSGIVTPVASPSATAAALENLYRNPGLAAKMGMSGRERVKRYYDIRLVMRKYLEIYEEHLFAGISRERLFELQAGRTD